MTDSLAARYGAPRRRLTRRTARLVIVAALVVAVAIAGWLTYTSNAAGGGVASKDIGFSTPDAWHAEVDFQISKDASATAVCAIRALAEDFAIVGYKEVEIGPTDGAKGKTTTLQRVPLRTETAAVSGVVDSCWLKGA